MMRRPPGEGRSVVNKFVLAAALLFIPWLVEAQQQQVQAIRPRFQSSQQEVHDADVSRTFEATRISQQQHVETPLTTERRKNTISVSDHHHQLKQNDASALALAPADPAVIRAPSTRRPGTSPAGLASPQSARSLEDWEVEDFVLLATVDGKLHARDRKTGRERWALEVDKPMVETTYYRRNRSSVDEDYQPVTIDDYLWIVEPSSDGSIYIYRPNGPDPGLINTGLTMKKLVDDMVPYAPDDPPIMYTGEKRTTMITVDARNGRVLKWFGTAGAVLNDESCLRPSGPLLTDNEECDASATLTLGRTEYTVTILSKRGTHLIASLKFSEWGPNNYDADLHRQYQTSLDNRYIYTSHDGSIVGFDHGQSSVSESKRFIQKFSAPVVRVFDVARPWGTEKNNPELIILPQPLPPGEEDDVDRAQRIFLNHTEDGSWYALSGKSYPWAVRGSKQAQCQQQGWWQHRHTLDGLNELQLSEALVGLHSIENPRSDRLLTISPTALDENTSESFITEQLPAIPEDQTILRVVQQLPTVAANSVVDFIKNPVLILFLIGLLISNQRKLRTWVGQTAGSKIFPQALEDPISDKLPELPGLPKIKEELVDPTAQENPSTTIPAADENHVALDGEKAPVLEKPFTTEDLPQVNPEKQSPEKKKAHRGRRGGVKHKKGPRAVSQDTSQDGTPANAQLTVADAVRDAKNMGEQTKLEPDIRTISHDPTEVSGPIIRVGQLEVNTDKLIGTGSNGTMVFEGNFDGRSVAVKRMLIQFFDIASQETKLLRESDDHPNVIRYYAQQQAAGFLYIALELCPASLADVIEKPHLHRDLAQTGERDLPDVLYQITNGLQHLHNLRIVHRDLKPQNILVSMGKDGKPRLLVSDFGLCKKLDGEQSSFRATTAHAAGTSGWRAPELLLDDDPKEGSAMIDASTEGNSGSILVSADNLPNRRATRAIDIFSLGLVFFYVLTKGSHPFDCGDRYMREVNIRKGKFSLGELEALGDYAFEAKDLITSMLAPEPRARPQAKHVMAHPFFWSPKKRLNFLCDVSDHFEKEKRDPPSPALEELERWAPDVCHGDFLKPLGKEFVESMGKQRKYTGTRLLDLLRALRNKRNHYEDMSDKLKKDVGPLPEGYLSFWTRKIKGAKPPSSHLFSSLPRESALYPARKYLANITTTTTMSEHTYKFNVTMTCSGCSGAVDRVLKRLDGVKSYDVSLDAQTATVIAEPSLAYETVLKTIKKTGKKVNSGEVDGTEKSIEVPEE
ncbi:hypothetical protein B7463_g2665, partial [Scytalidium lignicola]